MPHQFHELNRLSWNAATARHNLHKGDQGKFFREGGSTLFPEEIELLGDVRGRDMLHLQCNCGQDTLSIAKHLGAITTGVDISDEAIAVARRLVDESGIASQFERADVLDWCEASAPGRFDVVFASYGALCWIGDLNRWGRGVARVLRPGGRVVLVEFHPVLSMLADDDPLRLAYPYMGGERLEFDDGVSDYVEQSGDSFTMNQGQPVALPPFENPHPVHEFFWGIGNIVTALLDTGLQIDSLTEYPYSNGYKPYPGMQELSGKRIVMPEGFPTAPLMFSITAQKRSIDIG